MLPSLVLLARSSTSARNSFEALRIGLRLALGVDVDEGLVGVGSTCTQPAFSKTLIPSRVSTFFPFVRSVRIRMTAPLRPQGKRTWR